MYNTLYNRKISAKKMQWSLRKLCLILPLQMIMEISKGVGGPKILHLKARVGSLYAGKVIER